MTLAGSVKLRVRRRVRRLSPSRTRTGTGNLIRAPRGRQMVVPTRSRAGAEGSRRWASSQSHSTLAVSWELPGPGRARRLHHRYASCTRCVQAQTQCSMVSMSLRLRSVTARDLMHDDFVLFNSDTLTLWLFLPAEANYRPGFVRLNVPVSP